MPTSYQPATEDIYDMARQVMADRCSQLDQLGVTVCIFMASAERDDNGEPKGAALKSGGYPTLATVSINSLSKRAEGCADATIKIDAELWQQMNDDRRRAVLHHELYHLEPTGEPDDLGRPKLKMRRHDFQIGGFYAIIEAHQDNAEELQQVASVTRQVRELVQGTFWG